VTNNQAATTQPRINQTPSQSQQAAAMQQKIKQPPHSQESSNHTSKNQPRIKHSYTPCDQESSSHHTIDSKCKKTNGNQIHQQIDKQTQASKSKFISKCISKQSNT
jgi:membrane peptidoglycan carboxypeptidase